MSKKAIVISAMFFLAIASFAFAGDFSSGDYERPSQDRGRRAMRHQGPGPGSMMGKVFHDSMAKRVLEDLTGQAVEVSDSSRPMNIRAIVEESGVDRDAFCQAMDAETIAMAQKAADCGLITQDEADAIVEGVNNRPAKGQTGPGRRGRMQ
ncbi:hypothetical protein SAMN02745216_04505 [Desulfatibacillum alkenivorans DSM 16219]|uniref:DUF5333 domain-containing protein n=1 Tax=Desulfatibacillum alkenivorans DSM 16219 TaxID=1121393 RepID=A0A1M6XBZ4_9BACT|nr:hypothetical protein [Desulfatibacillum alkenivorans]SHL03471.1 hypothetical protein SAMN02745216_04505 [Desulfatibacillum alkenivorans DSM 16219]